MPESLYQLTAEITANLKSTGSFRNAEQETKNLIKAGAMAARSLGPATEKFKQSISMIKQHNTAMANAFKAQQAQRKASIQALYAPLKGSIGKVETVEKLKVSATQAADMFEPMVKDIKDSIFSMTDLVGMDKDVAKFGEQLRIVGSRSKVSATALRELVTMANKIVPDKLAKSKMSPIQKTAYGIKETLTKMIGGRTSGRDIVDEASIKHLGDQFDDAAIKIMKMPKAIHNFVQEAAKGVPITKAAAAKLLGLAQVATTNVTPGFEGLRSTAASVIPVLDQFITMFQTVKAPPAIEAYTAAIGRSVPKTVEATEALLRLAQAAAGDTTPGFESVRAHAEQAAAALTKIRNVQVEMASAQAPVDVRAPEILESLYRKLNTTLPTSKAGMDALFRSTVQAYEAIQNGTVSLEGFDQRAIEAAQVLDRMVVEAGNAAGGMDELSAAQRRAAQAARGIQTHTESENAALKTTQSLAQGLMMGYSMLSGSIMQMGFSLIFLKFSEVGVVLAQATLIAQIGILTRLVTKLTKSLIENGKAYLEQERLTRRFETDAAKKSKAYELLAQSAIIAGRSMEEMTGTWENLNAIGVAGAQSQKTAIDLAAYLGITASEAASKMASTASGTADEFKSLCIALGETDVAYIKNMRAQWNLMTKQQRMNEIMKETAKFADGAGKEYAESFSGLKTSIDTAYKYATGKLGSVFVKNVINPILVALRDFLMTFKTWVDEWMATEGAIKLMEQLRASGEAMGRALGAALTALGDALKTILPILLPIVSLGLKLISLVLYPLARSAKLLAPIIMILGLALNKYLFGVIVGKLVKLEMLQAGLSKLGAVVLALKNPFVLVGNAISSGFGNQLVNMMNTMRNDGASSFQVLSFGLKSIAQRAIIASKSFLALGKSFITSPIGIVVTVLGLLALVIMKNERAMAAFQRIITAFEPLIELIADLFATLVEDLSTSFIPVIDIIVELLADALVPVLEMIAKVVEVVVKAIVFVTNKLRFLMPVIRTLIGLIIAWKVVTWAMTAAQTALDAALAANPIGLVVIAILAIIAATATLYKYWDKLPAWAKVMAGVLAPSITLIVFALKQWNSSLARLKSIIAFFSPMLNKMSTVIKLTADGTRSLAKFLGYGKDGLGRTFDRASVSAMFMARFMRQLLSPVWLLVNGAKKAVEWIKGLAKGLMDIASLVLNPINLLDYILFGDDEEGGGIVGWIQDQFAKAKEWLMDPANIIFLGDFIIAPGEFAWDILKNSWNAISAWLEEHNIHLSTFIIGPFAFAWDIIQNTWFAMDAWFKGHGIDLGQLFIGGPKAKFDEIMNDVTGFIGRIAFKLREMWDSFDSFMNEKFGQVWENAKASFIDPIVSYIQQTIDGFVGFFAAIGDLLTGNFSGAIGHLKEVWNGFVSYLDRLGGDILAGFSLVTGVIKTLFSGSVDDVKKVFMPIGKFFTDRVSDIKNAFSVIPNDTKNIFDSAVTNIKTSMNPIISFFSGLWSGIKNTFETFVNGLIRGINFIIDGLNRISFTVPDIIGVPHRGETFGINIPNVPYVSLAKGGITKKNKPIVAEVGEGNEQEVIAPLSKLPGLLGSRGYGAVNINVYVTDNNIMNDAMVQHLSDEVSKKISAAMNRHRPVSTVGF